MNIENPTSRMGVQAMVFGCLLWIGGYPLNCRFVQSRLVFPSISLRLLLFDTSGGCFCLSSEAYISRCLTPIRFHLCFCCCGTVSKPLCLIIKEEGLTSCETCKVVDKPLRPSKLFVKLFVLFMPHNSI